MKLKNLLKSSIILSLCFSTNLLYSCNTDNPNQNVINKTLRNNNSFSKYWIIGKVNLHDFPNFNNKFQVKVIETQEVAKGATVSLTYPSDYHVENLRNTTIVAGVTDLEGNFKINPLENGSFNEGDLLVLEASKRIGGIGNASVSLQTIIKWNGEGWDSISKPSILLNKKTTAISIYSHFNKDKLTSLDTIGRMTVNSNGSSSINYDSKLTSNGFNRILSAIEQILYENKDPLEHIYSSEEFYFEERSARLLNLSLQGNIHTLQTVVETYAVDWGGVYPNTVEVLKTEAENNNYWKRIYNPYIFEDSKLLNYDDYLQIKETLIYNGELIDSMVPLKGSLVYKIDKNNFNYVIYGLNNLGEFLKDTITGNAFYLTNN